jgi:uncharacterized protein YigE (DUF2233 family)
MTRSRVPVGRIAVLVALIVAVWAIAQGPAVPRWRALGPGLEFGTLRGEPYCRAGSSDIALLRLDPAQVDLRVLHYSLQPDRTPLGVLEWQRRLGAVAVFNAGQYYPDYSYMGVLVSDGNVVSSLSHPSFRAALVAAPEGGGHAARVLDLDRSPLAKERPGWRDVAQSFMLFDARGALRVRRTEQVANRTAVAQDHRGRIVVITTEGGYTLWEFGQLIRHAPLGLSHAMSMDGGREAELCVRAPGFEYDSFTSNGSKGDAAVPLPAVIAVMRP